MTGFDWNKNREVTKEWNDLYTSLYDILKDGFEHTVSTYLFTTVMTEPHVFKKSQILSIKAVESKMIGNYMSLKIKNEDGISWVNVYPQFELKTEGKIRDIVLILLFIKDNIKKVNSVITEATII